MILVDTSVWVDHLRSGDETLAGLLDRGRVLGHPFVAGELALGTLRHRDEVLSLLDRLPVATPATTAETRELVVARALHGRGIGLVDAHLLASVVLTPGAGLWTRDRRLAAVARELEVAATPR